MGKQVQIEIGHERNSPIYHILESQSSSSIGRSENCTIVLDSQAVAEHVLDLQRVDDLLFATTVTAEHPVLLDDKRLGLNEKVEVAPGATLQFGRYTICIDSGAPTSDLQKDVREQLNREMARLVKSVHGFLCRRNPILEENTEETANHLAFDSLKMNELDQSIEKVTFEEEVVVEESGIDLYQRKDLQAHIAGACVYKAIVDFIFGATKPRCGQLSHLYSSKTIPQYERALEQCVKALIEEVFLSKPGILGLPTKQRISEQAKLLEAEFYPCWERSIYRQNATLVDYLVKREFKKQIKDIVFGYGPLEDLRKLPDVTEIMVVSSDKIYVDHKGTNVKSGRRFISDDVTIRIINKIFSEAGRSVSIAEPMMDCRLNDGSRVNAVIPPAAISGPALTIRLFPDEALTIEDLVGFESLSRSAANFLKAAVLSKKNVLISGGTGTGKTTMLNCLSGFIGESERIATIEDTAELQLKIEHVIRMECRQENAEGAGKITIQDLVRNALRQRPDRIIVGECRGPEALDMLQAMNTGHDGSMTTIHANSPKEVQERLEVLVKMANDLPIDSIHSQIASALDVIVHLNRERDGRRRVTHITEVMEVDKMNGSVNMKDVFAIDRDHEELLPTGRLPTFLLELVNQNLINIDEFLPS